MHAVEQRNTATKTLKACKISKVDLCVMQVGILLFRYQEGEGMKSLYCTMMLSEVLQRGVQSTNLCGILHIHCMYTPSRRCIYLHHTDRVIRWKFEIQMFFSLISHHNSVMI